VEERTRVGIICNVMEAAQCMLYRLTWQGAAQLRATVNAACGIIVFALNIIAQITISIVPGWPSFQSISLFGTHNLALQNYTQRDLLHLYIF
jgi:hypothetical protein